MKILYIYPLWGSENMPLAEFFEKVRQAGFNGVEMVIPTNKDYCRDLKGLIEKTGLKLIGHQHVVPGKETVEEYIVQMEKQLLHLASFSPLLINSHTGRDYFDFEDNCKIIDIASEISEKTKIPIVHETHRGRFTFSTYTTRQYFKVYPELKIAADFSHWCCVSESLLEDQEEFMQEAIKRTEHIHARVGNSQSAQVNHPGAPENQFALVRHLGWGKQIIELRAKEEREWFTITTEFGPVPYMPTLPYTRQPVASQWDLNVEMKNILQSIL